MTTKSETQATDVQALLRARNATLWIKTGEEARVEQHLFEAAAAAGYRAMTWDVAQGIASIDGTLMAFRNGQVITRPAPGGYGDDSDPALDPGACMTGIAAAANLTKSPERTVWIMRDLPPWLVAGPQGAPTIRQLRNLARMLPTRARESAQAVIVLTPEGKVPEELAGHATVIDWPLPDREEIADILDAAIESLPEELKAGAAPNGQREAAIDAAVGLSGSEAASCYARSLVQLRRIDATIVATEKKRVIAREGVLEWYDALEGGLDAVGGLENLKAWLISRAAAYSPAAREYGLPMPKGALLVGISGCGKSLTAKAIATAWGVPLLRLDLGALQSKYVGESQSNLRRALRVIEAIGRCVVWLDEVEKALQGATSGSADGGVSADALGTILTWMEERRGGSFVIATANDVSALPPEFLRKGRFDDVWFVDLPNAEERAAIVAAAIKKHGRAPDRVDATAIAAASDGFTGAEVAALVPDALYTAFADDAREITTDDMVEAAERVTPLSRTAGEKIAKLREWAAGRARPATLVKAAAKKTAKAKAKVALDL